MAAQKTKNVDSDTLEESIESYTKEELADSKREESDTVYVCVSRTSKRYHAEPDCSGLSNCTHDIAEVSVSEAEEMGKSPCRKCY